MGKKLPESSSVPKWIMVFGAMIGGIVLLFFMALVVSEICWKPIPFQARFLVVCVLSIGMAFAFAAMGGSAVASGTIALPSAISPIKFALGGGIAVFAVVLIMGYSLYVYQKPVDIKKALGESKVQAQNVLKKEGSSAPDELKHDLKEINKAEEELSYGQIMLIPANAPLWLKIALQEKNKGVKEIIGLHNNPRIIEYLKTIGLSEPISDNTPWCTAFMTWCIEQSGYKGTNSGSARSWLNWGEALDKPRLGAIVVFSTFGVGGHVGFYVGENPTQIYVLGGDQAHMVNISAYSKDRLLGYRWPIAVE